MKRISIDPRPNWEEQAKESGFSFHTMYGEPYWVDDAAYEFSSEEIDEIDDLTAELHSMCMEAVSHIVSSDQTLERLAIPVEQFSTIRESWERGDYHLYGRFDLAYDGRSVPKLLEYNADTPTALFETGFFQWNWMTDQIKLNKLPHNADQFNSVQDTLVEALSFFNRDPIFHFAVDTKNPEDLGTVVYLMDCAFEAGHRVKLIDISDIGIDANGRFTDNQDLTIERCFKLYPWEFLFQEDFSKYIASNSHVFIEPVWKSVLSNKGILPVLHTLFPDHPSILPAYFSDDPRAQELSNYVVKPLLSREGQNVSIFNDGGVVEKSEGEYGDSGYIVQGYAPLFQNPDSHAVIGSWVVGNKACGINVREDKSMITANLSRFVPHFFT